MKLGFTALALLAALGAGAAQAQTTNQAQAVGQILQRNVARDASLASDLARGKIDARAAAAVEAREAGLYRMEALTLERGAWPGALDRVAQAQRRVVVVFEGPREHGANRAADRTAERLDVQYQRTAALRDAEQQRSIVRAWNRGQLDLEQVAQLEAGQARLELAQARLGEAGHESVEQALRLSHLRDLQDWAIASAGRQG
jgi:hypothetical protein